MADDTASIFARLKRYVEDNNAIYPVWCCGVAADANQKLQRDHDVGNADWHMVETAATEREARLVEERLVELGCRGTQSREKNATEIYVYRMKPHTRP